MIRLAALIVLMVPGCAPATLLPDRVGVGVVLDADTGEPRTFNANLFWAVPHLGH